MAKSEESINLEGEKYLGKFKAVRREDTFWDGDEYHQVQYDGYWYEGTGIITDKETGEKYIFALITNHFRKNFADTQESWSECNYNLEESIVYFGQKSSFKPKAVPGRYDLLVDFCFGELMSQIKQSTEDIPTVKPRLLNLRELINRGYCFGENGQTSFAFPG